MLSKTSAAGAELIELRPREEPPKRADVAIVTRLRTGHWCARYVMGRREDDQFRHADSFATLPQALDAIAQDALDNGVRKLYWFRKR